ncbi:MAG: restriction endonuclease [Rubrobacter sp.]|nr:restriction endonuclease [Rubrobacter sp.]
MVALISLFVSLIMITMRIILWLLMMFINLFVRLVNRDLSRSYSGSRRHTSRPRSVVSITAFAVIAFLALLVAAPRLAMLLFMLAALAGSVWILLRRLRAGRYHTVEAAELARLFEGVQMMSGPQFEAFMVNLFRAMGYQANMLGGPGDQGVDILLQRNKERIAVQCKNHAKPVGNRPVQEVFAGMRHHRCDQAWVVAPAGYTKGAYDLVRSVDVSLFDGRNIKGWISQAGKKATPVPDRSTQSAATLQQPASTPSPAARKESPNLQVKKNRQSNDGPKSVNTGGAERDRREYEELLDRHGSLLRSMDIHTSAMEDQHRHFGVDPHARNKYREQYALYLQRSEMTRRMLDYLEERNPELTSGELSKRRTELNRKQMELKKRSERLDSKEMVDEQMTERKPASDYFKPLEL